MKMNRRGENAPMHLDVLAAFRSGVLILGLKECPCTISYFNAIPIPNLFLQQIKGLGNAQQKQNHFYL